ncbi:hypothetical protein Ahy_B02g061218 [Arachis hypogaea]|uniref:Uncharacterized protein n=1 Tax=Arachis hypogaea TaxID=3818 RepID=A0A445AKJ6_ARAHY|nr:hypothetical protein Ahy_B02g061218 [Arachis hypogaea]
MKEGIKLTAWHETSGEVIYRISISVVRDGVKYNSFVIDSDDDLQVLFHCHLSREVGEPNAVKDVLQDDDNVEPAIIDEDSDDDLGRSISFGSDGASSSGTQ